MTRQETRVQCHTSSIMRPAPPSSSTGQVICVRRHTSFMEPSVKRPISRGAHAPCIKCHASSGMHHVPCIKYPVTHIMSSTNCYRSRITYQVSHACIKSFMHKLSSIKHTASNLKRHAAINHLTARVKHRVQYNASDVKSRTVPRRTIEEGLERRRGK